MGYQIDRRDFLKVIGATGATTLLGCTSQPVEKLIPYVIPPEDENLIPCVAVHYSTVCQECPAGCGMVVRAREGRAVKVEGNPLHPVNRGSLCARGQASLQGLYNPDRIRQPLIKGDAGKFRPISWQEAERILAGKIQGLRKAGKADQVSFLTSNVTGSLDQLIDRWLAALGSTNRLVYEAFSYEPLREANRLCFGRAQVPTYALQEARTLINFGADFLETWVSPVGYARAFGEMRRHPNGSRGHFVQVEPRLSLTGANADEWVPIRPGTEAFLALGMIHEILAAKLAPLPAEEVEALQSLLKPYDPEAVSSRTEIPAEAVRRLAGDFVRSSPSLALAGGVAASSRSSTATLVAINLLNYVAGNVGKTVLFGPTENLHKVGSYRSLRQLVEKMSRGEVPLLLVYGANPAFTLPPSLGFAQALRQVPFVVSLSSFPDETAEHAHLVLPDHTPLESWGDNCPRDGVYGLMQPVMNPVLPTKAIGDVLLSVARQIDPQAAQHLPWATFHDYLHEQWKEIHARLEPQKPFEDFWEEALQKGGVWEVVKPEPVQLSPESLQLAFQEAAFDGDGPGSLYLVLYPSILHFDGRGANKPWLQELPDPLTTVVWDSWVEIHPATARRLGIQQGELITVSSPHGKIELPAYLYEKVRPDTVSIPFGQGHQAYGRYAQSRGASPQSLLSPDPEELSGGLCWLSVRVNLTRTGRQARLVATEGSRKQLGRGIAQAASLAGLGHPGRAAEEGRVGASHPAQAVPDMYPPHEHPQYRWGMVIDLDACIGCGACAVACYAENNLPVVGKEVCAVGREISWLRIERYFEEDPSSPGVRFVPMMCQQCDNAPCEPVCPAYATYHTSEGLNAQVYNRCVGTRYCANNCPYKVRRFNWFTYKWAEPLTWQLNPDVSVREMGVMEKCTFCFQRIREAKDRAKDEGRRVRDGEIIPACAQTCPTNAIVFGNLEDPHSKVARLSRDPRSYRILEELNTKPAVLYLRKVAPKTEKV